MNTANWLQDFVKWVITLRAGMNTFVLTHKGRERLIVALEQCVCHKPLLKRYLAVLQVALNGISRPSPLLTPEQAGRLASERVAVLDTRDLVSLALDPVSMWTLHDAVYEELPEWWTDRLIEADEEFLKLGPDTNDPPQSRGPGFPWDKLDRVSHQSLSALLGTGDTASLYSLGDDLSLPRGRAAARLKQAPSCARSLPTAHLAASQSPSTPNEACSPKPDIIRKYGTPYTFYWREAAYALSTDANAIVYVNAPRLSPISRLVT